MEIEERNERPIRSRIKRAIASSRFFFWYSLFATAIVFAGSIVLSCLVAHEVIIIGAITCTIFAMIMTVGFATLTIVALILNNKEEDMKLKTMEEVVKQGHPYNFARDDADERNAVLTAKLWVSEFWAFVGLLGAGALASFVWSVVNFAIAQHMIDKIFSLVLSVGFFAVAIIIVVKINKAKRIYPFNKDRTIDNAEKLIKHYEFLLDEARKVDER